MLNMFSFISHLITLVVGFVIGIYMLPIVIQPSQPSDAEIQALAASSQFKADFVRDLPGSDFLHWGEGEVSINANSISLQGELAPGPDYVLYLSTVYVDDRASFNANRRHMVALGSVRNFENFIVPITTDVNINDYNTVIVWCETFGAFISSAQYQL
ncbi:MAG TPA: hypothetical protein DE179_08205 [Oceanospirillaceae bacterium]|nr:hypothetical protein [Oceanospirillaceae bacterium]